MSLRYRIHTHTANVIRAKQISEDDGVKRAYGTYGAALCADLTYPPADESFRGDVCDGPHDCTNW
jgi:hypothetical protein